LPLIPESLAYGRIGAYQLFFERDGQAKSIDMLQSNYRLALTVPIEGWQFEFAFPRKRQ
jgi:hypothetical protein